MNENFEALNLTPSMAEEFIAKVSELQGNLSSAESTLSSFWKGASFDNFSSSVGVEQDKLSELQGHLDRVVTLINLVNEHNAKRREREALKAEIASLYGQLTYEEWNEVTGEMETHENPSVRESINRKEAEVERINRLLDQLVTQIDATTSI